MKKTLLKTNLFSKSIKPLLLAIVLSGIVGCAERLSITDYAFEVKATITSKGNNYINSNIPIEIQMISDVVKDSEVDVVMISNSASGDLTNSNGQIIQAGDEFKHKFTQPLRLNFRPSAAINNGELKFKVNGQEVYVKFSVCEATHAIKFEQTADTIKVGKAIDLEFAIIENSEAIAAAPSRAGGDSYTLSATMLRGKGILTINDKVLINNTKVPSYLPEVISKSADTEVALPKETPISALFTPYEQGLSTIQFSVTDAFGNAINQNKSMEVVRDSMKLKFISTRDRAELGTTLLYDMFLDLDGYTGKFSVQPTLISGSGVLQIDGQATSLTSTFQIAKTGTRKLIFVPNKSEKVKIAFDIYDEFGGFITDTLRGEVLENTFSVTTDLPSTKALKYLESTPFVVTIKQEAQLAEYTYIVKSSVDGVTLKKDNNIIELGKSSTISSGNHNFTFVGSACGDAVLTFEVKHATQDKKVALDVPIKVEPFPLAVNLLNQSASLTRLNIPITVDIQFATDKAPADTRYEIKPTIKKGAGTLVPKNDLKLIKDAYEVKASSGKEQFSYTPTTMGLHTIEFEVYDGVAFGQRKTVSFNVEVKAAEIIATPSLTEFDTHINENKAFNINVSEKDYTGKFQLYYDGGTGELRSSTGALIERKTLTQITSGTTVLAYKPISSASETLTFVVTDDYNQTSAFTIKVKGTHVPMSFSTTATAGININCAGAISLELGGATPFNIKYSIAGGTGTITKSDGTLLGINTPASVANTTEWKYIPTSLGSHNLTFTAVDKNGQEMTSTTVVNVTHVPMTFSTTSSINATVNSDASISLDLGGATPFNVKYTGGTGTMSKSDGTEVKEGTPTSVVNTTVWKFIPTTIGTHNLTFTAVDKNGQLMTSTTVVNVTHVPMTFSTTSSINATVNSDASISLDLGGASPFNVKYSVAGGTGTMKKSDGNTVNQNTDVSTTGNTIWKFTPSTIGTYTITFIATDKNGQSKTSTTTLTAAHFPMTFTGGFSNPSGNINVAQNIELNISGLSPFSLTPTFTSNGTLRRSGVIVTAGSIINGVTGNEIWSYTPNTLGSHSITFTAIDKNIQAKSIIVTTNATHVPMTFSTTSSINATVNSDASISLDLGGASPFKVKFSGGTGTMKKSDGNTVNQNAEVSTIGNTIWKFTPTTIGAHSLTFTAIDKNGQSKTSQTNVNVTHVPMTVSASFTNSTIYTNRQVDINISLAGATPLSVKYSGGNGTLYQNGSTVINQNTAFSLTGNTVLKYRAVSAGSHPLVFVMTDKNGQTKEVTATATAITSSNTISLSKTSASTDDNAIVSNFLTVSSNVPGENKYEITANVTGAGGTVNIPSGGSGIITTISGSIPFTFTPRSQGWGNSTITMTARNVVDNATVSQSWTVTNIAPKMETSYTFGSIGANSNGGQMSESTKIPQEVIEIKLHAKKKYYSGSYYADISLDNPSSGTLSTTSVSGTGELSNATIKYTPNAATKPTPFPGQPSGVIFGYRKDKLKIYFKCGDGETSSTEIVINVATGYLHVNIPVHPGGGGGGVLPPDIL